MRVADFFCGAGGFSEGFRQAGFEIVFAVDNWIQAVDTYRENKNEFENLKVICDDVIRISNLPDEEFNRLIPDTEIIIGSPPCVDFSNSNKSGKADKSKGIQLIEAYLRIVARKYMSENSILEYWILENVPNVEKYLKDQYTAKELGLDGDFILNVKNNGCANVYNAKYFGAPTSRKRYLCGNFPVPQRVCDGNNVRTLGDVLNSLGETTASNRIIEDPNYDGFTLPCSEVTDHFYSKYLADFEWEKAKRLKQDMGYMGRMSFPEDVGKPSRTIMATMSASSREAMILYDGIGYRLPTVREVATLMSYPIDYWFVGKNVANKYKLVGNSVPPKLSYALAVAIMRERNMNYNAHYHRIAHTRCEKFINLNGNEYPLNIEKTKKYNSVFRYHIPYMKINQFRVELTNKNSDFSKKIIKWNVEIHYSQGIYAKVYTPKVYVSKLSNALTEQNISELFCEINRLSKKYCYSKKRFHEIFRMTKIDREQNNLYGPLELLSEIKLFLSNQNYTDNVIDDLYPIKIYIGYYILKKVLCNMN